jgi:hypothetical protein
MIVTAWIGLGVAVLAPLLIWAAWWHPAVLVLLVAPTAASCVHRLATQRRLSSGSAR